MTADQPPTTRLPDGRIVWTDPEHDQRVQPFQDGHTLSLHHGAYSERAIEAKAAEVHGELLRVAPWCAEERYLPSVSRYLQATAREQLAHKAIMTSSKPSPRLIEVATACARLAWSMADALGLTPAGHARLKVLVADATEAEANLAELAATGAAIRARRQAALDGPDAEGTADATD
jgi:hypothetical protein